MVKHSGIKDSAMKNKYLEDSAFWKLSNQKAQQSEGSAIRKIDSNNS